LKTGRQSIRYKHIVEKKDKDNALILGEHMEIDSFNDIQLSLKQRLDKLGHFEIGSVNICVCKKRSHSILSPTISEKCRSALIWMHHFGVIPAFLLEPDLRF
jgi:hypothetical protein